ncbi:MAG: hypothetical protein KDA42_06515 [Planctomycetales bacterium]|nr:hypothetical protein [Planctomycetales bacterium]
MILPLRQWSAAHASIQCDLARRFFRASTFSSLAIVATLVANVALVRADDSILLFDFEHPAFAQRWAAVRSIQVERKSAPAYDAPEPASATNSFAPAGAALAIHTAGQGGLYTTGTIAQRDWSDIESLAFWVYRQPPPGVPVPSVMEVQFIEADGKARFWRRIVLEHEGWQRIELPLYWFRWGEGRVPQWDRVARLGFWFRDAVDVVIDSVAIAKGRPDAATLTLDRLSPVAFPSGDETKIRRMESPSVRVLTDASELDIKRLGTHLEQVAMTLRRDLGEARSASPATLLVFENESAYRSFPRRLAKQMGSSAAAPRSSGYTLHGIATSSWSDQYGTLRPVYTHEFVHSLVALSTGIPNHGQWLHEGLAVRYQLRFHPQADFRAIVLRGLGDDSLRLPLAELCTDNSIPNERYWQAMTVVEMLIEDDRFSACWPKLLAAFSLGGSANLAPHLESILATDWDELESTWRAYCETEYGGGNTAELQETPR